MSAAPATNAAANPVAALASQFVLRERLNNVYTWPVPHGFTREQLLDPACWANVASQLKVNDTIIAIPESGEWYARLHVTEVGQAMARVRVLEWKPLIDDVEDAARAADYAKVDATMKVKWCGPTNGLKWCVERNSDKKRLFQGFTTKDEAYSRALEHMTG